MQNPLISIIVPIFNAQKHISSLLSCITNQSEQSFELILVDDGSTDNTLEICTNYALRYPYIKIIKNKHQGVSASRNSGINNAISPWITFIDSDDLINYSYIESISKHIKKNNNIDLVCSSYLIIEQNKASIYTYKNYLYSDKNHIRSLFTDTNFLQRCSVWGKLFKRDIIVNNNIKFNIQLHHSEDRLFLYKYLEWTNVIYTSSSIGYYYGSFNPNSLKHNILSFEQVIIRQQLLTEATINLTKKYNIAEGDLYIFQRQLLYLLKSGMQTIYNNFGFCNKTLTLQNKLYESFNIELHEQTLNNPQYKTLLENDGYIYNILSHNYKKNNLASKKHEYILKIKILAHHILKRKKSKMNFNDFIKVLNNK